MLGVSRWTIHRRVEEYGLQNMTGFHHLPDEELDEILRVIFSECRKSKDSHENSIFLLFRQNIPLGELIQEKIVQSSHDLFYGRNLGKIEICI